MKNRFEARKGSPSAIPRVLDESAFAVLLNWRHELQMLFDLQKAKNLARVKAVLLARYVTPQDGRPIVETKMLKLSNLANKLTSFAQYEFTFVVVVKSVIKFSAVFLKEHGAYSSSTWVVNSVDDTLSGGILTGNGRQTYQDYIGVPRRCF